MIREVYVPGVHESVDNAAAMKKWRKRHLGLKVGVKVVPGVSASGVSRAFIHIAERGEGDIAVGDVPVGGGTYRILRPCCLFEMKSTSLY